MQRLCVFCGSSTGNRAAFVDAAHALGTTLARRNIALVYGGHSTGVMGALADAVLAGGGTAIGIIPRGLNPAEVAHPGLSELRVVSGMHERKEMMESLADGFLALPGGFGTFEELFEMLTWLQLGIHSKPVAVLDVDGYWRGLHQLVRDAVANGFIEPDRAAMLLADADVDALLDQLAAWKPPALPIVWLTADES
jgi:uncharacterized protein (TIGR00730 family)